MTVNAVAWALLGAVAGSILTLGGIIALYVVAHSAEDDERADRGSETPNVGESARNLWFFP